MPADGRLRLVHRGVYPLGHLDLRPEAFRLAAVLACGPGAVLSHRSGAGAWGVRPAPATFVEVTSSGDRGRRQPGIRLHRSALLPEEVTEIEGVPVTTWERAMLELASVESVRDVRRALERSEQLRPFDGRALQGVLARHRGERGAGRLRKALEDFDDEAPRTRTELEAQALDLIRAAALPRPLVNALVLATRSTCSGAAIASSPSSTAGPSIAHARRSSTTGGATSTSRPRATGPSASPGGR